MASTISVRMVPAAGMVSSRMRSCRLRLSKTTLLTESVDSIQFCMVSSRRTSSLPM